MVLSSQNQRYKSRFHAVGCEHSILIKRLLSTVVFYAFMSLFFKHGTSKLKKKSVVQYQVVVKLILGIP